MADIQGTSLHYFIYICIVQATSVSTKTTTFSWFYFWAKWIILQHLLVYFSDGKNKPIKRTKQFISTIKNIPVNVLTCYPCSILMSFILLSVILLSKELFQKKMHITLTNTCVNKDGFLFVWTNSWMHMFGLVISSMCVLILGCWYWTGGWWKFILTERWANQMC